MGRGAEGRPPPTEQIIVLFMKLRPQRDIRHTELGSRRNGCVVEVPELARAVVANRGQQFAASVSELVVVRRHLLEQTHDQLDNRRVGLEPLELPRE